MLQIGSRRKIRLRIGGARLEHVNGVVLEVGDIHPPLQVEANAAAAAAIRQIAEQSGLRGAFFNLADAAPQSRIGAGYLEADHEQVAGGVDRGSLDALVVFSAGRQLFADEQLFGKACAGKGNRGEKTDAAERALARQRSMALSGA